ncbi:phosphoribosylamine--glycine ligase [Oceanithermus profundus DSM 14977]|uniref:Phosphoribosylamine--glycine ligase n=1 Tax=Oceanithermus profundus (strain DSM 14977 / NBRC 100410 / VKM B-2274 / 506) TaxID=670487 RepID=E4U462_OCEP5|nr:phosphoribosylamine--glycine ligase [Oceanithermus profundus]ADR36147.1 phosphoribosylamine--glycine ligase [Oceanithermus profundus DSM 14977]
MAEVLVVGGGGREHALAWALAGSPEVTRVYVAPGNAGTVGPAGDGRAEMERVPLAADDLEGLTAFAARRGVALTVVGPEAPLAAGLVDRFAEAGLAVFGPRREAARIEASKAFAKALMDEAGVPTASWRAFDRAEAALAHLEATPAPWVVKASGLAAGKGVLVTDDYEEARAFVQGLFAGRFGAAGRRVVIEAYLEGPELSVFAVAAGERFVLLPPARDYKRIYEGGLGPNTGGMGALAPVALPPGLLEEVGRTVIAPTLAALAARGAPYLGVLYAGLKLTPAGPKVLEFNARFGDPETQAVLPLLQSDLYRLLMDAVEGRPDAAPLRSAGAALAVVLAAPGYPGAYPKGLPVEGLEQAEALPGVHVFHAGTERAGGRVVTAGGRVLAVVGRADTPEQARTRAYAAVRRVHFEGMHYRRDIGTEVVG